MAPARVVIVDDSVVVRRVVSQTLSSDPGIEVVAVAADGRAALEKIEREEPDLVLLDIEMPGMDGLETLRALRRRDPHLPVLIFSALTERGGELTLDALNLGASDYVTKPTRVGSTVIPVDQVRAELLDKIRALVAADPASHAAPETVPSARGAPSLPAPRSGPPELVVVAASTGGPNALESMLCALPASLPVPVAVVQHMPRPFTRLFADRLDKHCALHCREAAHGVRPRPGEVWIAPGDEHLAVARDEQGLELVLHRGPHENGCRPSADALFRSAAEACGGRVLAAVLTGMGHDGLRGCERIRAAGGRVVVQDEATSVVWGMPGAVARGGLAEAVLPLEELAEALLSRAARPGPTALRCTA